MSSVQKMQDPPLSPRKAKPTGSLQEKDPLLAAFKDIKPDEVDSILKDDDAPTKESTSLISEETHVTSHGSMKVVRYGCVKHKKVDKKLKCCVEACTEIFPFVKELNGHMKEVHPDVKFHCKYCPKMYDSHNAHYKHEASHFQYRYLCHYCTRRFQFPGLREKHERQHTRNNLLPCTWPGCKAQLSCQDALNQHIVTHNDQRFDCPDCDKDFNTISNLKQHIRGKHGDGFISLCGASFDWSDDRNDHQQDCTECSARKDKLQNKPEFPGKRKQWKRSIDKDNAIPFMETSKTVCKCFNISCICYRSSLQWDGQSFRQCFPLCS